MNDYQRFIGTGHWVNRLPQSLSGIGDQVKRYYTDQVVGILRDDSDLALNFNFGTAHYTAQILRSADSSFNGSFIAHEGDQSWQGVIAGRLFYGSNGILFYGSWMEDPTTGVKDTFWVDLITDSSLPQGSRFVDVGSDFVTIT